MSIFGLEGVIMNVQGLMTQQQNFDTMLPKAQNKVFSDVQRQEPPVIDENEIKSILYLGLKGGVKSVSEDSHAIDTFA